LSSGTIKLIAVDGLPDGEVQYPKLGTDGIEVTLPEQIMLAAGARPILVRTRVIGPNLGGMAQVSSATLRVLGGNGELDATWSSARFRDLVRYSKDSRRRCIGVALAGISAILAAVKEGSDAFGDKASWLVAIFLLSAIGTLVKEGYEAVQDFQSVREDAGAGKH
jgi:hypothetical protein